MVSIMVACCVGVVAGVDVDAGERCVARHTNDENGGKIDAIYYKGDTGVPADNGNFH